MWPPSSGPSTGFLLPTFDSRHWCWPSRPSMELHLSTSKHCSDQTPQLEHFALLHQLAGWYRHRWEQTKPSRLATLLCSGTSWVERTPDQCLDSRIHSLSSAKYSRHICSEVAWLRPPTPSTVICCGFFLVTNILFVSRFGRKPLLNALNVNAQIHRSTGETLQITAMA